FSRPLPPPVIYAPCRAPPGVYRHICDVWRCVPVPGGLPYPRYPSPRRPLPCQHGLGGRCSLDLYLLKPPHRRTLFLPTPLCEGTRVGSLGILLLIRGVPIAVRPFNRSNSKLLEA